MLLGEMAERVMGTRTFEETIQTILDDVITFHGAQYGAVQLPVGDDLVIAAQRGFGPQFLRMIRHLKKDNGFSCGRAQRDGQSIVVADVEKDPDYALYRNAVKEAGFRSVQSTPFVTEDGKLIGIVSVHFAAPGGPTQSAGGTFRLYSIVAAEHAHGLLGGVALAAKAERMSDELYSSFAGD
jgi:GAF domain-containing protein